MKITYSRKKVNCDTKLGYTQKVCSKIFGNSNIELSYNVTYLIS